ncbi:hypothetical protein SLA2020_525790 [Shorea laevis]
MAGVGAKHSGRVFQSATEKPADDNDWVLCFSRSRRGPELLAEADVAVQCFLSGDGSVGSLHHVLDGLDTEAANPAALVACPDAEDIGRSAFLSEAAAVAFNRLNFGERGEFGQGWLSLCAGKPHVLR